MPNIEMLQALHGDAFILHCQKNGNNGVIVVDGGPYRDSRKIVSHLDALNTIDLMVLTHYDDDHIGGVLAYIKKHKADRPFPVKHMWVNCAYDIPIYSSPNISFGQAKKLANELKEINECLVKEGFSIIDWETPIVAKKESIKLPFADILILSPNAGTKDINDKNYMNAIHNANIGREYYTRQKQALKNSLSELALVKKRQPKENDIQEVINWSSIAFVVRSDKFSMLMLGDSYPCSIVESLKSIGYSTENPLSVDFVKISHHGSRNNISNELLDMIDCDRFLISTNGGNGTSCHPDRETIANIACHAKRDRNSPIHLYFNYSIKKIENVGYKFIEEKELEHYNIVVHEDVQQITKELA
ncbi:MBL fold metallo-hydrolase [uncultured Prevotella sp.]|uniref:ComEC/Rec2 family competence protein n=1 Tax=uncultured Prevotella sp. TaxID=159272 RepID=UPI0027E32309|nr:MBL fold metallo-hydrolase [uncultured Prevotella sp.]